MHIREIGFDAEFWSCGRHELRRLNFRQTGNFASKPSELSFFLNIKKDMIFNRRIWPCVYEEDCFLLMLAASCTSSHNKCF
jgi:hypothetical protein